MGDATENYNENRMHTDSSLVTKDRGLSPAILVNAILNSMQTSVAYVSY